MTTRNRHRAIIVSASLLGAVLALSACEKKDSDAPPPNAAASVTPAASAPAYVPPTAAQLSQMVAPIALFPDKLVAQVLAGSTYPDQIVAANQWLGQNGALKGDILQAAEERQPWDVSVKSLTQFPAVLSQMAANPDWTRALGDAFVNDPNDVMNAIQALRLRAQQAGNLKNSAQLRVSTTVRSSQPPASNPEPMPVYAGAPVIPPPPQTIVIESSRPDTVYVPAYDPAVVYGPPVPVYPGYAYRPPSHVADEVVVGALSFGVGVFVGEAVSHHADWGWHDWGMHWGGPSGGGQSGPGWQHPAVVYRNTTYVSHSTTVINRVTTNNVTINNNRVVNNNVNNVNNVRNVSNVDERNINREQTRIDNRQEAGPRPGSMSMPHFTAGDARAGAMPAAHASAAEQQQHRQPPMQAADPQRQDAAAKEAARAEAARQHQEMEQQTAREHQQAQQNAAQQERQQARQQAEQRQAMAARQEAAHAQPARPEERREVAPAHQGAAARPENRPGHAQQPPAERHEAAAHEHASEQHAAPKHEPARHEEDKHGNERHEAEKHNG